MGWLAQGLRWAGVACAALLIPASTTAHASRLPAVKAFRPYWVAHGQRIAFYGQDKKGVRLWVMKADGGNRHALTEAADRWEVLPVLSPSGRRFADSEDFGNEGELWIGWPSGKTIRRFPMHFAAQDYGYPDWSPDDGAVALNVVDSHSRTMILVGELGDGLHMISHIPSRNDENSEWSPDSQRIAFVSCLQRYDQPCNLVVIRRDGTRRQLVLRRALPTNDWQFGIDVPVAWAPSGRMIGYAVGFGEIRPAPHCRGCTFALQRKGIYVVRLDGSGWRRVAGTSYMQTDSAPDLSWSPDGKRIAVIEPKRISVVGVNAGARPLRILRRATQAAWSPDGRRIAFVDPKGVTILEVNTGTQLRLTSQRGVSDLSWAPSARLLFARRGNVYTALPGRPPRRVFP